MPLVAGILWNRLLVDMRLEVDATIQYAIGNEEDGWWRQITSDDRWLESPYNTYRSVGLPPHAIANPGLDAIEAVIYPQPTNCLFYIHDRSRNIHCAATFEQHQRNISIYLR